MTDVRIGPAPVVDLGGTKVLAALIEAGGYIDDRELNLKCANLAGMRPIQFLDTDQLRAALGITT